MKYLEFFKQELTDNLLSFWMPRCLDKEHGGYLNCFSNDGIGGEIFCPWLAESKNNIEPDYILVAYGTNHWHSSSSERFADVCEKFYDNLVANYPNAKIFALTPIWRKDRTDITRFKSFEEIGEIIAEVVKKYDNVTCISGRNFIPEDETLFSDLYLHPNDAGFKHYSEGIKKALELR